MHNAARSLVIGLSVIAFTLLGPATAEAAVAGKVLYAFGQARSTDKGGSTRTLRRGVDVEAGDKLTTGARGRLQVRFTDGGFISLKPDSEFQIDEYRYTGKEDGKERGFFSLFKGALRAVTGAVGKTNRQAYRLKTPVATIGIRGTAYTVLITSAGLLVVTCNQGAVFLANAVGTLVLTAGQSATVEGDDAAPQQVLELSAEILGVETSDVESLIKSGEQRSASGTQIGVPASRTFLSAFSLTEAGFPNLGDVGTALATVLFGTPPTQAVGVETPDGVAAGFVSTAQLVNGTSTVKFDEITGGGEGLLVFEWRGPGSGDFLDEEGLRSEPFTGSRGFNVVVGTEIPSLPATGSVTYQLIPGAVSTTASNSGLATGPGATSASMSVDFLNRAVTDFELVVSHNGASYEIENVGNVPIVQFTGSTLFGFGSENSGGEFFASGGSGACSSSCQADVEGFFGGPLIDNVPGRVGVAYGVAESDKFFGVAGLEPGTAISQEGPVSGVFALNSTPTSSNTVDGASNVFFTRDSNNIPVDLSGTRSGGSFFSAVRGAGGMATLIHLTTDYLIFRWNRDPMGSGPAWTTANGVSESANPIGSEAGSFALVFDPTTGSGLSTSEMMPTQFFDDGVNAGIGLDNGGPVGGAPGPFMEFAELNLDGSGMGYGVVNDFQVSVDVNGISYIVQLVSPGLPIQVINGFAGFGAPKGLGAFESVGGGMSCSGGCPAGVVASLFGQGVPKGFVYSYEADVDDATNGMTTAKGVGVMCRSGACTP